MSGPRARRPPRQAPSPPVWPGRPVSPTLCHAGHYVGHGDGRPRTVPTPARSEGRRSGALRKRGKRPHPKAYHYALEPTTYDRERAPASTPTRVVHHPATARSSGGYRRGPPRRGRFTRGTRKWYVGVAPSKGLASDALPTTRRSEETRAHINSASDGRRAERRGR